MAQDIRINRTRTRPLGNPPNQAIVEAARKASRRDLAALAKAGGDLNGRWRHYRPLHAVIQMDPHQPGKADAKRISCLKWLLAHGADPEALGAWPPARAILIAAFSGESLYIQELRKSGARVDGFLFAAMGDAMRVERILRDDPEFAFARDTSGLTALHCCAASRVDGDPIGVAKLLLDQGADPNAVTTAWGHGLDAVHFSVSTSKRELFSLLLERGAAATAALSATLWRADTEFTQIALEHGANIDSACDEGKPVLNQMVRWGRITQALLLLEKGASPNRGDERGWTAMHQAAALGNEGIIQAMLKAGGDSFQKSKDGRMPMDIAKASGRAGIVKLLGGA